MQVSKSSIIAKKIADYIKEYQWNKRYNFQFWKEYDK